MWCDKCLYGSAAWDPEVDSCPQCGADTKGVETKSPFPSRPENMGSGKPNGKTARKRHKVME